MPVETLPTAVVAHICPVSLGILHLIQMVRNTHVGGQTAQEKLHLQLWPLGQSEAVTGIGVTSPVVHPYCLAWGRPKCSQTLVKQASRDSVMECFLEEVGC